MTDSTATNAPSLNERDWQLIAAALQSFAAQHDAEAARIAKLKRARPIGRDAHALLAQDTRATLARIPKP